MATLLVVRRRLAALGAATREMHRGLQGPRRPGRRRSNNGKEMSRECAGKKAGGLYQTARPGIRDAAHPRETASRATALLRRRCFQRLQH
jgi:hypothetical protein